MSLPHCRDRASSRLCQSLSTFPVIASPHAPFRQGMPWIPPSVSVHLNQGMSGIPRIILREPEGRPHWSHALGSSRQQQTLTFHFQGRGVPSTPENPMRWAQLGWQPRIGTDSEWPAVTVSVRLLTASRCWRWWLMCVCSSCFYHLLAQD